MQRKWFYRLLLSYMPVFVFVVLLLCMAFYYRWSEETKERIQNTNDVFAAHVMNVMDSSFLTIENYIVQQLLTDETIKNYYNTEEPTEPFIAYQITQRLNELKTLFPFAGDVYLYKASNQEVITDNAIFKLDQFADRSFVEAAFKGGLGSKWTSQRSYNQFIGEARPAQVVSLAKLFPITSAIPNGVVVINIQVGSVQSMLQSIKANAADSISLTGADGHAFFDEPSQPDSGKPDEWGKSSVLSAYTGWKLEVKVPPLERASVMASFLEAWMLPVLGLMLLGLLFLTYMTHRNYKPIEEIMIRIDRYTLKRSLAIGKKTAHDEFHFIASALDNLVENSHQYEKRYLEDLSIRKKYWFYELLDGQFSLSLDEWRQEAEQLKLPEAFASALVMIVEIDNYQDFRNTYSVRDQQLFKFVIRGVMQEIAQGQQVPIWLEWKEADQLVAILYADTEKAPVSVDHIAEAVKTWVSSNLQFTTSVYVGSEAHDAEDIGHSYQDALRAGEYRTLHGYNHVYFAREVQPNAGSDLYRHLQAAKTLAKTIRAAEPSWLAGLEAMFAEMRSEQLQRDKVLDVVQCLFNELDKMLREIPEDAEGREPAHSSSKAMADLAELDLVDEMQSALTRYLAELVESLGAWQQTQDYHHLIEEVKTFLQENFGNPDLSLQYLSERFELSTRMLSRVFKTETGERFVDYLIRIRLDEAKRLLVDTSDSVQSIAEQAGYLQVISFIRAFKKREGLTPGEYRKLNQSS
ncbi:helix-turn-helix domain-containing protein [Paenibacillus sp. JDR-2]|uniref:helix-turn-helix domain-containing protein n=1 Tax=Paenibacillus sp. (strain JDR-2) TaxID=324057 RepID=UPI000166A49A|nr:helix-turn-helix domain-containing protein [Paenibacillus sp. JDR-2]ACT00348.1 transcriptional regulator, AraC family [Paenibacillus sp. JDR-2]